MQKKCSSNASHQKASRTQTRPSSTTVSRIASKPSRISRLRGVHTVDTCSRLVVVTKSAQVLDVCTANSCVVIFGSVLILIMYTLVRNIRMSCCGSRWVQRSCTEPLRHAGRDGQQTHGGNQAAQPKDTLQSDSRETHQVIRVSTKGRATKAHVPRHLQ